MDHEPNNETLCSCGCGRSYQRTTVVGTGKVGTVPCNMCGNFVLHHSLAAHLASLACVPPA
jgi:hypothetical protein